MFKNVHRVLMDYVQVIMYIHSPSLECVYSLIEYIEELVFTEAELPTPQHSLLWYGLYTTDNCRSEFYESAQTVGKLTYRLKVCNFTSAW